MRDSTDRTGTEIAHAAPEIAIGRPIFQVDPPRRKISVARRYGLKRRSENA
jgi:hypothetical protein